MEIKANIIAKDGQALLGKHFHVLEDHTKNKFKTDMIKVFINYISTIVTEEIVIVYNSTNIAAMPKNPTKNSVTIAACTLQNSVILDLVCKSVNRQMTLAQMEAFLYDIRKYWGPGINCKNLYDLVRDFTLKKLTTFERKKDNAGNFIFAYSRKDEKGDVKPPDPIKLRAIPIFNLHNVELPDLEFDIVMDYRQSDESAEVFYTLRSPFFNQVVMEAQKDAIEGYLADTSWPKFWGTGETLCRDDSWKYLGNGIN
jgi:hypothetical protein